MRAPRWRRAATQMASISILTISLSLILPSPSTLLAQEQDLSRNETEDAACQAFADRWTISVETSRLRLKPEEITILSGCYRAVDGSWFLPTGLDDPRLPGPILTGDERQRTERLRSEIQTQLDEFSSSLPGWIPAWLEEVYDPANHALMGHARDGYWKYDERQKYGGALVSYLQDPNHQALARYTVWWAQRRLAAFSYAECAAVTLSVMCRSYEMSLKISDNYGNPLPPWPWDLSDPLTLDTYLKWALDNGYVP